MKEEKDLWKKGSTYLPTMFIPVFQSLGFILSSTRDWD